MIHYSIEDLYLCSLKVAIECNLEQLEQVDLTRYIKEIQKAHLQLAEHCHYPKLQDFDFPDQEIEETAFLYNNGDMIKGKGNSFQLLDPEVIEQRAMEVEKSFAKNVIKTTILKYTNQNYQAYLMAKYPIKKESVAVLNKRKS